MTLFGREILCPEEKDLARVARDFALQLQVGDVCLMRGEMGSGKTFFTTHVVEALGGDSRMVASPSYTLVHEYPLPNMGRLYHIDLYRLDGLVEEDDLSQGDWMEPEGISFVEWSERLNPWKPERGYVIELRHLDRGRGLSIFRI